MPEEAIAPGSVLAAVFGTGVALAGPVVTGNGSVQADREAFQEEIRSLRPEIRAGRKAFEKHITRPTREQSQLNGVVERMRSAGR